MVTAEAALALPAFVLVLCAAVSAVLVATAQMRCVDAAREGARAAARGESAPGIRSLSTQAGPRGASTTVRTVADRVQVTVEAKVRPLGGLFPDVHVVGKATGMREPGEP